MIIKEIFEESVKLKCEVIKSDMYSALEEEGGLMTSAIIRGNKILFCGNGGSAADSQHLAAELLIRLRSNINRQGIPALALAVDTSTITACGNDIEFEALYERMVDSLGDAGDVLVCITTSGNSENIIRAAKKAIEKNMHVFGLLGGDGGGVINFCDKAFVVPSGNTGRVQEVHITAGHALMEYVEDQLIELGFLDVKE